jgi:hypothetical protein
MVTPAIANASESRSCAREYTHSTQLLRCAVDFEHHQIRCYRLRRREPDQQPQVKTIEYVYPTKRFIE